jgi:hypothetical protein
MGFFDGVKNGCGCVFGVIIGIVIVVFIVIGMCTNG